MIMRYICINLHLKFGNQSMAVVVNRASHQLTFVISLTLAVTKPRQASH